MMGLSGLLVIGLIFYVIIRYGTDEDFGIPLLRRENEEGGEDAFRGRPHPLHEKFSSSMSREELFKLGKRRFEAGYLTEEEWEHFKEYMEE